MADRLRLETSGHVMLETTGAVLLELSTLDHPEGFLSVAFDDPALAEDPEWTTIDTLAGVRVRDWTIDRGRPNEFSKTDVGTASVRIVDRAGVFDPTNPSSDYAGKILPGKQAAIALQNPIDGEWHTLFRGFIESWHYKLGQTEEHMELELQLVDGFAILARAELRVGVDGVLPPYTGTPEAEALAEMAAGNVLYGETTGSVGDRINAILGDVGWPVSLRDIFSGNVRVGPKAYSPGTSALDALFDAVDAELVGVANFWCSSDGAVTFRGRQARFRPDVAEYHIHRRDVGDPSATSLDPTVVPVSELEFSNGQDNLFNSCTATPQGIGSGLSWRPLDPEVDDIPGQLVKAGDPGVGGDPDSIEKYGLRSLTFDNLQTIVGTAGAGTNALEETKKVATYYVENYSSAPAVRISRMVFKSRRPDDPLGPALWKQMCEVEISDLLTLKTDHPGSGGFDGDWYVEGIHYTGRPGAPGLPIVELSLDVSPRQHYTTNPFDEDGDP
jgi:hypothetical protein